MEGRDPPEDASIAHLAHVPAASALPASPAVPAVGVPVPLELAHASPAAGWQLDFLKGFISGQVVVFLLLWFLVRLVFLRNADEADADMRARRSERSRRRKDDPRADAAARYLSSALILGKVYGDDPDRPEESCDWLSVLLAQLVEKYRRDGRFRDYILGRIDGALNAARPGWLGAIVITEFSLGEEYPLIKGAKIRPCRGGASVRAELTFELRDYITLGIDTHLVINWPRPSFATLPISLALSVVKFRGTVAIEFVEGPGSHVAVSILDDYQTEFDVRSLLGHRTKIKDLPKLTELLTTRLRALFEEKVVEPKSFRFGVPDIGEDDGSAGGEPERGRRMDRDHPPSSKVGSPHLRTSRSRGATLDRERRRSSIIGSPR